jgi:hypothetical protein
MDIREHGRRVSMQEPAGPAEFGEPASGLPNNVYNSGAAAVMRSLGNAIECGNGTRERT